METNKTQKIRFKFSALVWILMVSAVLITATGLALNVISFFNYVNFNTVKAVTYAIVTLIDLALLVFLTALIVYPYYIIDKESLVIRLGLFVKRIKLSDVTKAVVFKKSKKLVVYFNNSEFIVILINERKYQLFVEGLRAFNRNIFYDETDETEKNQNI